MAVAALVCQVMRMKMKHGKIICLLAITAALASGCTVGVSTPGVVVDVPGPPVVEVGVPDSYVWDGYEYVGLVGGTYYYLGPGGGWLVCDDFRLGRFHGWERNHPDWHRHAIRNEGRNARGRAPARREERRDEHR
jgi:hypothetical protein